MKNAVFSAILLTALGAAMAPLFAAGPAAGTPPHSPEEAWSFKAGQGVTLGSAGMKALGIATAGVQTTTISPPAPAGMLQIYQAAADTNPPGGKSLGSVFLGSGEAKMLAPGNAFEARANGSVYAATVTGVKPPGGNGLTEVLAAIDDPGAGLRTGDFLEARLAPDQRARPAVTAIPLSAVVESVRGPFVYVLNGRSFLRTPVKLGTAQDRVVEVLDGLFEGDEVVTNGAAGLWMVELQAVNGGKGCGDAH